MCMNETRSIKISMYPFKVGYLKVCGHGRTYIGSANELERVADFVQILNKNFMGDPSLPTELDVSELPKRLKIPVLKKILETPDHYF